MALRITLVLQPKTNLLRQAIQVRHIGENHISFSIVYYLPQQSQGCRMSILFIFSEPQIISHAESIPQHSHLHHSNYDWCPMGILSVLYERIPKFQKQNHYHSHPRSLVDGVVDLADSAALTYQDRKSPTSQNYR